MIVHLEEPPQFDVDSWHRLQVIIRKLPVLFDKESFVPQAALLLAVPEDAQQRPRGDKAAIRELSKLARHLTAAMDCYENLPPEAVRSLCEVPPGPEVGLDIGDWPLMAILMGLREQTLLAKAQLDAKPVKKGGGRPPDYRAADVAIRALGCYEFLTAEKAGVSTREVQTAGYEGDSKYERGGPFVRFLTNVYEELGIEADVGYHARAAMKERPIAQAILWAFHNVYWLREHAGREPGP